MLWGRCWEAGGAPAYWPWVQSIRAHIAGFDEPGLRACAAPDRKQALVCDGDRWHADPPCAADERCEPRSGRCLPVAAECSGQQPGVPFCAGDVIRTCADSSAFEDEACGEHATCSSAGMTPTCTCAPGYEERAGGCVDIDECATGSACGSCPSGFSGDGEQGCQDIDECAADHGGCDALTACVNTVGGRTCGSCPSGFSGDGEHGCHDIDECAAGACGPGAGCANLQGSFTCCGGVDLMRDAGNCGACGRSCDGGQCLAGRCQAQVLASGQQGPQGVVVDGANAFWANHNGSTIMKVALSGGAPVPVVSGVATPLLSVVDATHVYWTNYENGSVFKASLLGGAPELIASGQYLPAGMLVDAASLYWVTADKSGMPGTVMRAPLAGGPPITLATSTTGVTGLALVGGTLYWASGHALRSVPKDAGDVLIGTGVSSTVVASADGTGEVGAFAIRETQVYWVTSGNTQLVKVSLAGGASEMLASAPPGGLIQGLVVDHEYAYYALNLGQIMKVALRGGEPVMLVSEVNNPVISAIDDRHVYWVEVVSAGARIMRVAK